MWRVPGYGRSSAATALLSNASPSQVGTSANKPGAGQAAKAAATQARKWTGGAPLGSRMQGRRSWSQPRLLFDSVVITVHEHNSGPPFGAAQRSQRPAMISGPSPSLRRINLPCPPGSLLIWCNARFFSLLTDSCDNSPWTFSRAVPVFFQPLKKAVNHHHAAVSLEQALVNLQHRGGGRD
jgi:hypothetical protein